VCLKVTPVSKVTSNFFPSSKCQQVSASDGADCKVDIFEAIIRHGEYKVAPIWPIVVAM
jgi:hypothetical protein